MMRGTLFILCMTLSDLPSPAEAGFAKAGNRFPLFGIMLISLGHDPVRKPVPTFRDHALGIEPHRQAGVGHMLLGVANGKFTKMEN